MADRLKAWWSAGWRALLPIIPADAPLAADRPAMRAKSPGLRRADGRWSPLLKWQQLTPAEADIACWDACGAQVGLRLDGLLVLDLDEDDPRLAAAAAAAIEMFAPATAVRGRTGSSRAAWFFRYDGEAAPSSGALWYGDEDRKGALQVFAGGKRQMVVAGPHRDGGRYGWVGLGTPAKILAALAPIGADEVLTILDAVVAAVRGLGARPSPLAMKPAAVAGDRPIGDKQLLAADPDEAEKALFSLDCGEIVDRDDWVKVSHAYKAAVGGDEARYARYFEWCRGWDANTDDDIAKMWNGIAVARIGADWLFSFAALRGTYRGAGNAVRDFGAVEVSGGQDDSGETSPGTWISRYVYVLAVERYVDLETMQMLSETAFKRLYSAYGHPSDSRNNAAMIWQLHAEARKVASLTYRPGEPRFVVDEGRECLNTWRAPDIALPEVATASDVAPWLAHATYLVPDLVERELVFDWMAYRLQRLDRKVNFALCLGGDEGIGKNLLMSVLHYGLGQPNIKGVDQADIEGSWTDWAGNCVLVVIEELHHFGETGVNKIKKYITVPPTHVRINIKNIAQYDVPNAAAILAYTNHRDALRLDNGDRRWMVVWSDARPREEEYYAALAGWLAGGGGAAVVRWLLSRDLSSFAAQGRAPMTAAKQEMRELAAHPVEAWVTMAALEALPPLGAGLVRIDAVLEALPRHLATYRPSLNRVANGLRAAGGKALGQFRLGRATSARTVIWAVRDVERYADMEREAIVAAFWAQDEPPVTQVGLDFIEQIKRP